jgi:hypothetical protein
MFLSRAFTSRSHPESLSACIQRTGSIGVYVLFVRTLSTSELWSGKAEVGSCVVGTGAHRTTADRFGAVHLREKVAVSSLSPRVIRV